MKVQFRTSNQYKMALDIPNNRELFGQGDVRETATAVVGTSYLSIPPTSFRSNDPDVDDVRVQGRTFTSNVENLTFWAPVILPHGAVVTAVIVYGNTAAEAITWQLRREILGEATLVTMATAVINTEDTSITSPIIDNSLYSYSILCSNVDTSDAIEGVRITYTI